ncbi:aldo/keto reductase [Prosthecomicrobium sp. N25]|uniref:aldo/keto reductase n=1 Tax=Prosthecomicrobium sp. N25 TaxID=3129254 RepID=UPI003076DD26
MTGAGVDTFELAPGYVMSRVLRGGWQLAGGHGEVERERAVDDMAAFLDAGVTTFDCADIYTGVEEMIGLFRERLRRERGEAALAGLKVHTKYVPDWSTLGSLRRADVEAIIDRSLRRLGAERLDLVQFHWWNYAAPGMAETAGVLVDLQQAGKIHLLGGTNFDRARTADLLDAGYPLASMQVQYSLLDARPENGLAALAAERGFSLIAYGSLAGGFLSSRWLGRPEPTGPFENRGHTKYKLIIDDFGGWELFQDLLGVLDRIAGRHGVGIPAVATRYVLEKPQVAGVIVGARYADRLGETLEAFRFALDAEDHAAIAAVLARRTGPGGDTFALERDRNGKHGRIMKYELNKD